MPCRYYEHYTRGSGWKGYDRDLPENERYKDPNAGGELLRMIIQADPYRVLINHKKERNINKTGNKRRSSLLREARMGEHIPGM